MSWDTVLAIVVCALKKRCIQRVSAVALASLSLLLSVVLIVPVSLAAQSVVDPLDAWIVTHYRGANLLSDSAGVSSVEGSVLPSPSVYPRIESTVRGERVDSLFAVAFSPLAQSAPFSAATKVRFMSASGTIMRGSVRIVAHRMFRAPRLPGQARDERRNWRYGHAYLIVVPHQPAQPLTRLQGWFVIAAASVPASEL